MFGELQRVAALLELGRPREALVLLTPLAARHPDHASVHRLASVAHSELEDHDRAWAHAVRAVALDPGDAAGHRLAATAAVRVRRRRKARAHARTAVRLDPLDPASHQIVAVVLARSWNPARRAAAIRAGRQSVGLAPGWPSAHFALGYACHRTRRRKARAAYRRCLALDPQHLTALNNLAALDARLAPAVAVDRYVHALAAEPQATAVRHNLEWQILWVIRLLFVAPLALSWLIRHVDPAASTASLLPVVPCWILGAIWYRWRMPAGVRGNTVALILPTLIRHRFVLWGFGVVVAVLAVAVVWMGHQTRA